MKKRCMMLLTVGLLALLAVSLAQTNPNKGNSVRVALVKMPYVGERNVPDTSRGPDYLEQGGIQKLLEDQGVQAKPVSNTALTTDEEKAYGSWNKLALASGDLAKIVSAERRSGYLPVGLLANCNGILGMLSGLQHSGPGAKPLRVGMVFIDAHGDFNTPETTLSGMLGGMPVAIAAGQCLTRMRIKTGLEPAIPTRHNVDMDALDPREVSGHPLTVPGGPTSLELAAALTEMFKYEKVTAFGVASTPFDDHDKGGLSRQAAYNLILGAVKGVQQRKSE